MKTRSTLFPEATSFTFNLHLPGGSTGRIPNDDAMLPSGAAKESEKNFLSRPSGPKTVTWKT
jgi:hypothetical protein